MRHVLLFFFFILMCPLIYGKWQINVVNIAAASATEIPLHAICDSFSKNTKYECKLIFAPAGHLYAHIMDGIAYDLMLSADQTYMQGLIHADKADQNHRVTLIKKHISLLMEPPKIYEVMMLKTSQHKEASEAFLSYLKKEESREMLQAVGYSSS